MTLTRNQAGVLADWVGDWGRALPDGLTGWPVPVESVVIALRQSVGPLAWRDLAGRIFVLAGAGVICLPPGAPVPV